MAVSFGIAMTVGNVFAEETLGPYVRYLTPPDPRATTRGPAIGHPHHRAPDDWDNRLLLLSHPPESVGRM